MQKIENGVLLSNGTVLSVTSVIIAFALQRQLLNEVLNERFYQRLLSNNLLTPNISINTWQICARCVYNGTKSRPSLVQTVFIQVFISPVFGLFCVSWWRHQWKHFPRYWPLVRWIHRSPVNSQHKGQWRVALMFSLICSWINGWVNNHEAGDLWRHFDVRFDVTVVFTAK